MHSRIEAEATTRLGMQMPGTPRTQVILPDGKAVGRTTVKDDPCEPRDGHRLHSRPALCHVLKLERWRVWTMLTALMLLFMVLLARGLWLQAFNEAFLQGQGDARYTRTLKTEANRGMITDRNGDPLAISTPVQSIWASPRGMTLLPPGQKRDEDWEPANDKDPVPVSQDELKKTGQCAGHARRRSDQESQRRPQE